MSRRAIAEANTDYRFERAVLGERPPIGKQIDTILPVPRRSADEERAAAVSVCDVALRTGAGKDAARVVLDVLGLVVTPP